MCGKNGNKHACPFAVMNVEIFMDGKMSYNKGMINAHGY